MPMSDQLLVSRGRCRLVGLGAGCAGALGVLATVLLARLALDVGDVLAGAGAATVLTTFSAACCALVCARLTLCLAVVAGTAALPTGGPGHRRAGRVALALSPAWLRPAVALLLAAGVSTGSAACEPPPRSVGTVASGAPVGPTLGPRAAEPLSGIAVTRPAEPPSDGSVTPPAQRPSGRSAAGPAQPPRPTAVAAPTEQAWQLAAPGLPDPEWQALPGPGWRAPPPPPAPLLLSADASLVTSGAQRAASPLTHPARTADERLVVHRGDSLWTIAARALGTGATDAEVAAEWPRWWHANRAVIGANPDLLRPGTRLLPPK
jgi:hypothetical protein